MVAGCCSRDIQERGAPDPAGARILYEGDGAVFEFAAGKRNVLGETGTAFYRADLAQASHDGDVPQAAALIFAAQDLRGSGLLRHGQKYVAAVAAGIDLHANTTGRTQYSDSQLLRTGRRADGGNSAAAIAAVKLTKPSTTIWGV